MRDAEVEQRMKEDGVFEQSVAIGDGSVLQAVAELELEDRQLVGPLQLVK